MINSACKPGCATFSDYFTPLLYLLVLRGRHGHGHGHMVVEFTTTYAISAYHHWSFEFESRSGEVYLIQHYVIKFVSNLWQVGSFLRVLQFPPSIKQNAMI